MIIAVIPAYNEERSIAKVVLRTREKVDRVIVVDDGSTDGTGEIGQALGAAVIRHRENLGYGAAMRSAFEVAKELNATAMVTLDADGQHDPKEIPLLLKKIKEGFDIVIGSRLGGKAKIPRYRRYGISILNFAMRRAHVDVTDSQSGYRAYSRNALDQLHPTEGGMSAGAQILLQARNYGLKICEVPIKCDYSIDKPFRKNPLSHGFGVLMSILRHVELSRPLFFFGLIGIFLLAAGMAVAAWVLRIFGATGRLPFGPSLLMILLIILAIFTLYTAIILHALSRLWSKKDKE
ncbi:Undecaprenyl-phosphate 4-deoxy-4-formamido-L-arabinose transferase [subsurface metagenome]